MAQVFLGRHKSHGGLCAIKVLSESLSEDATVIERFKLEAQTAAVLSGHPNIVPIFDVNEGQGLYYIVMQYVIGEDLSSLLKRTGCLSPGEAMNVAAQVAEALNSAAAHGIVHRDLKPANIRLDRYGRFIVLDFGIAKAATLMNGLTRTGESMGTLYYMPPEQILGLPCDSRSDLYSLGCVLFEIMTGRRPFQQCENSEHEVRNAHLGAPIPSILNCDPTLPKKFADVVSMLMQKNPEDRYQSATELLRDLHAAGVSSGPGELRPVPDIPSGISISVVSPNVEPTTPLPRAEMPNQGRADTARTTFSVLRSDSHLSADSVPPSSSAVFPHPASDGKPRRKLWFVAGTPALAVLLLGIAVLIWSLAAKNPPRIIEDPSGRMVLVPAGAFVFGDNGPDSPNRRQVLGLPEYYIDETEVSNTEYKRFCDATDHPYPRSENFSTHPEFPVSDVSLEDARSYARWTGKRLPSEQEWEKAARGTDGRIYPWGDDPWIVGIPSQLQSVEYGLERESPFGARNMAGNVYEWTESMFPSTEQEYSDMQQVLGTKSFSREWHVIKGGSFSPHGDIFFRTYMRRGWPSDQTSPFIGFRCVRTAKSGTAISVVRGWFQP